MKKILQFVIVIIFTTKCFSQSISPSVNSDYCPLANTTFTVTLPIIKAGTTPNISSWTGTPIVVSGVSGLSSNGSNTTFTFVGQFRDENSTQVFKIDYQTDANPNAAFEPTFKKIKSLTFTSALSNISTNIPSISSQICQITSHSISFTNIPFSNAFDNSVGSYGTNTDYEYLLPTGWSLNGIPSTGTWMLANNNVTVTSDLSSGHTSSVQIRAINSCGSSLHKSPIIYIPIYRPEPPLSISGSSQLCFPNSYNYTLSGVPSGGVVTWNTSSYYSVSASGNTATISPTSSANGGSNITASVYLPSCGLTFTKSFPISIGAPYVTFNIVSYPYEEPSCYEVGGIYTFQAQQATGYPNTFTGFDWGWRNLTTSAVSSDLTIYGSGYSFFPDEAGNYEIWVRPTNQCGSGLLESVKTVAVYNICRGFRSSSPTSTISIYPNPAKDIINLTVTTELKTEKLVVKHKIIVELYESITASKVKEWKFDSQQKTYSLSIQGLKKGIYYLRYINGDDKKTKQIIIE